MGLSQELHAIHGNRGPRQGLCFREPKEPLLSNQISTYSIVVPSTGHQRLQNLSFLSRGLAVRKREGGRLGFRGRTGTRGHAGLSVSLVVHRLSARFRVPLFWASVPKMK